MASNEESRTDVDEIMKSVEGHDRIIIEDEDGTEYTLRYTRQIVKQMEKAGVTSDKASALLDDATLTGVENFIVEFVAPAFKSDQPKMTKDEIISLWRDVSEKEVLIAYLIALFNAPMTSLLKNPTETRAKFRLA